MLVFFFLFSFFKDNLGGSKQPSAAAVDVASSAAAVPSAAVPAADSAAAPDNITMDIDLNVGVFFLFLFSKLI